MLTKIVKLSADAASWDAYVRGHPNGTLYHLSGWEKVIQRAYGHRTYYLAAGMGAPTRSLESDKLQEESKQDPQAETPSVVGILPLVYLKHPLFGNRLVSIPFFDMGGILANDAETEATLLCTALVLARRLKVDTVELRQQDPAFLLSKVPSSGVPSGELLSEKFVFETRTHKVRMVLRLPESSASLMDSFKAKLRSQIKKPLKEGLVSRIGGRELLDDFYEVFSINMRDLGSPVHSRDLIAQVLDVFSETARIVTIYKNNSPVACSVIVGFGDMLENPWASALREHSRLGPNMLLYWTMLEYACDKGFRYFDFGRSSPDEGTYRFKEQWGAIPSPLHWHYVSLNGKCEDLGGLEKSKYGKAIQYWQKLPVPFTRVLGPMIRKHIGL
jgi:FemAB-related protein (PEP-CTERM system-associated)